MKSWSSSSETLVSSLCSLRFQIIQMLSKILHHFCPKTNTKAHCASPSFETDDIGSDDYLESHVSVAHPLKNPSFVVESSGVGDFVYLSDTATSHGDPVGMVKTSKHPG